MVRIPNGEFRHAIVAIIEGLENPDNKELMLNAMKEAQRLTIYDIEFMAEYAGSEDSFYIPNCPIASA